jgi:hypothetical protein
MFGGQFSAGMLNQLMRHIWQLNEHRLPVTSLDFLLYFTTMCCHFQLDAIDKCLPFLHYCEIVYLEYRKSSIAVAAVCFMT